VAGQDFVRVTNMSPPTVTTEIRAEATAPVVPCYRRPQLTFVGTMVRTVQSGPSGNRNETYQGSYWSGR
jgi:hypothetical protein